VNAMKRLAPPQALRKPFEEYLDSRREVQEWDRDALVAAEEGDAAEYAAARENRNVTEDDRKALAEEIGFRICSGSDL
jgi:hypothetical protein